jgi:hypothetical protein
MPDKSQWPKSTKGFFMHPPLLTTVAGRPKTERHKGNGDKEKGKGNTSVLFVRATDIIGIIARRANQKTLKL